MIVRLAMACSASLPTDEEAQYQFPSPRDQSESQRPCRAISKDQQTAMKHEIYSMPSVSKSDSVGYFLLDARCRDAEEMDDPQRPVQAGLSIEPNMSPTCSLYT